MNMIPLKEDGSLDIDMIEQLSVEEHMKIIGRLTDVQYDYYMSKLPLNENSGPTKAITVDYDFDDERSGVDLDEYLKQWDNELH